MINLPAGVSDHPEGTLVGGAFAAAGLPDAAIATNALTSVSVAAGKHLRRAPPDVCEIKGDHTTNPR